ncbi:hypothetical protein ACN27E_07925 [Mycobacterium sp. WMMD1722]|uniref:hypothetical protein n=1 Tax=Mycobacterium sp. WMMD1722 TaxID=3404117 RepID=UPI003BF53735
MSATCGFDWCANTDDHKEHTWTDGVSATSITGKVRHVSVWNSIQEGCAEPILIGIEGGPEEVDDGYEAWLTIDDAEHLLAALTQAIQHAHEGAQR